jgi:hypothetical protein
LENNIYVMQSIYIDADLDINFAVSDTILKTKDHPAVLMWYIGNEWNYNNLYSTSIDFDGSIELINIAAQIAKNLDPTRAVASIYGELPSADTIQRMPLIDIWGTNVYRELGFGEIFEEWAALSGKPLFIGEYGADAYNSNPEVNAEDQEAQALATAVLTEIIFEESTFYNGVCSGGILFELADEWWKAGNDDQHDVGGIAPGGGPYPDGIFNEEWWGLVDINRQKRQAFDAFKSVAVPGQESTNDESDNSAGLAVGIVFGLLAFALFVAAAAHSFKSKNKKEKFADADNKYGDLANPEHTL